MANAYLGGLWDVNYEIARGRLPGWTTWNKFGYNADIDTTTDPEIVAAFGGTFSPLTTAYTLDVASSSAEDGAGSGTGASSLQIIGIGDGYIEQSETVNLNGTGTVVTSNTWLGVNRVQVLSSGSNNANVGNITLSATTEGSTQAYIPAGESVTQQAIFHVPANKVFLADWLWLNANKLSGGGTPRVTIKAFAYADATTTNYEVFREVIDTSAENTIVLNPSQPFIIGQKQTLYFTAETTVNDTIVNIRFSGVLAPL